MGTDWQAAEIDRWVQQPGQLMKAVDLLAATVGPAEGLLLLEHRGPVLDQLPVVLAYRRACTSDRIPAAILRRERKLKSTSPNDPWAFAGRVVWIGEFNYAWSEGVKEAFWRLRAPMGLPEADDIDRLQIGQKVQWMSHADSLKAAHRQQPGMRVVKTHVRIDPQLRVGEIRPPGSGSSPPR